MKEAILFFYILLITGFVHGQAKNDIVVYKRTHQPAASISLPYEPDLITTVLSDQLLKKGSHRHNLKGFILFKNVQFLPGDPNRADLYFKVVRNGMSGIGASIVYLMVGMPNENIAKRSKETHFTKEQAKAYLNDLIPIVEYVN